MEKNKEFKNTVENKKFFQNKIYSKHINSYGKDSASDIRDNSIINYNLIIENNKKCINKNTLMVGKVQSGKTASLEMFTALAFDNEYNIVIIFAGLDNSILNQTKTRFQKQFDADGEDTENPYMISTVTDEDKAFFDSLKDGNLNIDMVVRKYGKVIITLLKRPDAINALSSIIANSKQTEGIKAFIIDDEGDQASLNIKGNEKNIEKSNISETYRSICKLKDTMKNPMYLSVTATPHANIFLQEYSRLKPDFIRLINTANNYCGANKFHYDDSRVSIIEDIDNDKIEINRNDIMKAINYFLISSFIMIKEKEMNETSMIIHNYAEKYEHSIMEDVVNEILNVYNTSSRNDPISDNILFIDLKKIYNTEQFSAEIIERYELKEIVNYIYDEIMDKLIVIKKNSDSESSDQVESFYNHKIYIGGNLLQRGITFKNLTTSLFTRWAKKGSMDTTLQRARWFGYRNSYIDICKIFTTKNIANEFSNQLDVENDLWDQFESIQNGDMDICDLVILRNEGSTLLPTSNQKASFNITGIGERWINQREGILDEKAAKKQVDAVNDFLNNIQLENTSVGRMDSQTSAKYTKLSKSDLRLLTESIPNILSFIPYNIENLLIKTNEYDFYLILLTHTNKARERKFNNGAVSILQQGRDSSKKEDSNYLSDRSVVIDKKSFTIQLSLITPKIESKARPELNQYMVSFLSPISEKNYKKKDLKDKFVPR